MKTAFVALVLSLVSSSAFATSPKMSCDMQIEMSKASIMSQASALGDELTQLVNDQIREDGEPMIARYVNGRMAVIETVVDAVNNKDAASDSQQVRNDLCALGLSVREYVLSR